MLLVLSPQPTSNPNQTQKQNQLFLQKLFIDDVAGQHTLLLLIFKKKIDLLLKQMADYPFRF